MVCGNCSSCRRAGGTVGRAGRGYIWYGPDDHYYNGSLLQYSGRATVAVDRRRHFRVGFTVRTWRDTGRPIQQWLSTTVSMVYGFGKVR